MPKAVTKSTWTNDLIIGIDPGQSGAIACFIGKNRHVVPLKDLTESDIYKYIDNLVASMTMTPNNVGNIYAMLEKVHAMPKQGVSSTFKFGRCFGMLEMCLVCCEVPYELVSPQKWQRALNCLSKGDKNVTKRRAQQLFPDLKITHATADALLIAEYCRRIHV